MRKEGYYWVRMFADSPWEVANYWQYNDVRFVWTLNMSNRMVREDGYFYQINENRIPEPE